MDLDPAAVEAAAESFACTLMWGEWSEGSKAHYREEAQLALAAAYPIIAEAVARATADAIADKIEAAEFGYRNGPKFHAGMHAGAYIARSFGRTPETDTTEATE